MNDPLPIDVIAWLNHDFGDRADKVAALLLTRRRIGSADYIGEHLVRCIVYATRGDERRLQQLIALEQQDSRDVIVAGEYDGARRQVRDLRASFLVDRPDKLWVGEVTCMMASRGYLLIALETRSATTGPFVYTSDYGEGTATYTGPKGEIEIEKKERQWTIRGNRRDLEIHELNHAFNDERTFRDGVSGYLLSNIPVNPLDEANKVPTAQFRD